MRRLAAAFIFSLPVTWFVLSSTDRINNMQAFQWLSGSWKMSTPRGAIIESWSVLDDSTLTGESVMIKTDGEKKQLENIRLVFREQSYYYIPVAIGQNNDQPVKFRITSRGEKGFVAENPDHDFPKRIIYTLVNSDSLHAVVDDGEDDSKKRSRFYFSKVKN